MITTSSDITGSGTNPDDVQKLWSMLSMFDTLYTFYILNLTFSLTLIVSMCLWCCLKNLAERNLKSGPCHKNDYQMFSFFNKVAHVVRGN